MLVTCEKIFLLAWKCLFTRQEPTKQGQSSLLSIFVLNRGTTLICAYQCEVENKNDVRCAPVFFDKRICSCLTALTE